MKPATSPNLNAFDPPVVLMLHGFFGAPHNWRACVDVLSAQARVLVPRLPFFGVAHRGDRLEHVLQFLAGLLADENARRVVVMGNSLGGQLALNLALREPERVAGLVLTGSSGLYERNFSNKLQRHPDRAWVRARIAEIFYDPALVAEDMVDEIIAISGDRQKARDAVLLARTIRRTDVRELLPRVRCPVQLIWGEDDRITPPAAAREFQARLPAARLAFIPRCGHAAMMERPEEFNRLAENFLRQVSAPEQ